MSEEKRGCGYRQIWGLYLTCDPGQTLLCDGLPLELEPCDCCGFVPPFSRNLQRIQEQYIIQAENKKHESTGAIRDFRGKCSCPAKCPICYPVAGEPMGLMFVGKKFYTPKSFIREAETMGVCKRIPDIPKWLRLGETWILLAHFDVPKVSLMQLKSNEMHMKEPEKMRAIFYAFRPQRIEIPMWKGQLSDDEIQLLKKRGITPVLLEPTFENQQKHGYSKSYKTLMRLLKTDEEE